MLWVNAISEINKNKKTNSSDAIFLLLFNASQRRKVTLNESNYKYSGQIFNVQCGVKKFSRQVEKLWITVVVKVLLQLLL